MSIVKLEEARNFYSVVNGLNKFGYYCNADVFKYLFGNDGMRLWECFVEKCNRNILEFYCGNYMDNSQMIEISYRIIHDEEKLRMIANIGCGK